MKEPHALFLDVVVGKQRQSALSRDAFLSPSVFVPSPRSTSHHHKYRLIPKAAHGVSTDFPSVNYKRSHSIVSTQNDEERLPTDSPLMAGAGSPSPYIKNEPDDLQFDPNRVMANQNSYNLQQQYGHHGDMSNVDPSNLSMNNGYMQQNPFGSQNMSSSFAMGHSGIADDELENLGNLDEPNGPQTFSNHVNGYSSQIDMNQNHGSSNGYFGDSVHGGPVSMATHQSQLYSHTPDGAPIQSPFVNDFNYSQFRSSMQSQGNLNTVTGGFGHSTMDMNSRMRPQVQQMRRQGSDSRSPHTPALNGFQLGTPETGSFPGQPIQGSQLNHRHQKSLSGQWDSTPGSNQSLGLDSPLASPTTGPMHPQISEVLKSGKHQSLPSKSSMPPMQSQEAKKKKRRDSHNLVERRRRDNINERIQELARLVPQHRLEDDKVRKHLMNNSPLSPSITATGMSPPAATSLLASSGGRRATGAITQGLPLEDKDKGPNKGDILSGSVAWTRDLMWMLREKLTELDQLKAQVSTLGGNLDREDSEEERRMLTELELALSKSEPAEFFYSRSCGTGLRVPRHTNIAGDAMPNTPQSLSPNMQGGANNSDFQFLSNQGGSDLFKEEDEYVMDLQ
ncbi:MAG: hypothetical protein M1820_002416 [Bogoriella megaspora]|nr:MAG: hypothetical protein M1820_002416 [Bogoriella megaspora]